MTTESIRIRVAPEAARAYRSASEQERRKIDLLLGLRLREATRSVERLEDVMREVGQRARARGLTEDELPDLLRDV